MLLSVKILFALGVARAGRRGGMHAAQGHAEASVRVRWQAAAVWWHARTPARPQALLRPLFEPLMTRVVASFPFDTAPGLAPEQGW